MVSGSSSTIIILDAFAYPTGTRWQVDAAGSGAGAATAAIDGDSLDMGHGADVSGSVPIVTVILDGECQSSKAPLTQQFPTVDLRANIEDHVNVEHRFLTDIAGWPA